MTSQKKIEVIELKDYSGPTYNKLVHSAMTRSTVVNVVHKLTVDEWRNFLSLQCRNYSRDPDHAHLRDSQSSLASAISEILYVCKILKRVT